MGGFIHSSLTSVSVACIGLIFIYFARERPKARGEGAVSHAAFAVLVRDGGYRGSGKRWRRGRCQHSQDRVPVQPSGFLVGSDTPMAALHDWAEIRAESLRDVP